MSKQLNLEVKTTLTLTINDNEVYDTGKTLMTRRVFIESADDCDSTKTFYFVNANNEVESVLSVNAASGQNTGYISSWSVNDYLKR